MINLRVGIRTKLFASILLILLCSYALLFVTTIRSLSASIEREINRDLENELRYIRSAYTARGERTRYALLQPSTSPLIKSFLRTRDRKALRDTLVRWHDNLPFLDLLLFVDANGRVLSSITCAEDCTVPEMNPLVVQALRERVTVESTERISVKTLLREGARGAGNLRGETALVRTLVLPVMENGKLVGGIVAGEILDRVDRIPAGITQIFGRKVEISLNVDDTPVVSTAGRSRVSFTIPDDVMEQLSRGQTFRGQTTIEGKSFLAAFEPVADSSGHIVGSFSVLMSRDHYRDIRRETLRNIGWAASLGVFLSFVIAWIAARQLTEPLRRVASSAAEIEAGDLEQQLEVSSSDEIDDLVYSFNRMTHALLERDRVIEKSTLALHELNEQLADRIKARTLDLEMEKGRLEAVLTGMAEGVVVTDADDRMVLVNPTAQKIFGVIPAQILGRPVETLCDCENFRILVNCLQELKLCSANVSLVEQLVSCGGRQLQIFLAPLSKPGGDFAGGVMSIRDVTAEKEVERMKGEFISAVSHELKTPLTSMKGSLQLVISRGERLSPDEKELLSICSRNTDRLIRLTEEILDITRPDPTAAGMEMKPLEVRELVEESVESLQEFAARRQVSFDHAGDGSLPPVYGNRERLLKVLFNLLSNGVRFSRAGEAVEVSAERDGNFVKVTVADRGPEISWTDSDSCATAGEDPEGEGERGGLGLAVCRDIIERHYGRISYTPRAGGGNLFSFTVPVYEEP